VDCEELYDCSFSAWSSWSSCNSSYDQSIRFRGIEEPASPEGNPCRGPLNETKACSSEDGPQSCLWTQWGSWGRCSVSCGDGRHERMRRIERKSDPGGLPCWGSSLENGACNNGDCQATDCRLSQWGEWSECEALNTQRYRRRSVEVAPSYGGATNISSRQWLAMRLAQREKTVTLACGRNGAIAQRHAEEAKCTESDLC